MNKIAPWERIVAIGAAILIVGLVAFLVIRNEPFADPNLVALVRIPLSLSMAVLGATVPGFLSVSWKGGGFVCRAGGALALFLLTYTYTPEVLREPPARPGAATGRELKSAVAAGNTDAEVRKAVVALVTDLKQTPLLMKAFYPKPHAFIDERWRKCNEKAAFYESSQGSRSLLELAELASTKTLPREFFSPACGVHAGRITQFEQVTIDGHTEYRGQMELDEPGAGAKGSLNPDQTTIYFVASSLVGDRVLRHINEGFLPDDLRAILQRFNISEPAIVPFSRAVEGAEAFIVAEQDAPAGSKASPAGTWPTPTTGLRAGMKLSAFLGTCRDLGEALSRWSRESEVALDLSGKAYLSRRECAGSSDPSGKCQPSVSTTRSAGAPALASSLELAKQDDVRPLEPVTTARAERCASPPECELRVGAGISASCSCNARRETFRWDTVDVCIASAALGVWVRTHCGPAAAVADSGAG